MRKNGAERQTRIFLLLARAAINEQHKQKKAKTGK